MDLVDLPGEKVSRVRILVLQHGIVLPKRFRLEQAEFQIDIGWQGIALESKGGDVWVERDRRRGIALREENIRVREDIYVTELIPHALQTGVAAINRVDARLPVGRVEPETVPLTIIGNKGEMNDTVGNVVIARVGD